MTLDMREGVRHNPNAPITAPSPAGSVTGATDNTRPCRRCARPRPMVAIGSSRWWDLCSRCASRAMGGRRG